MQSNTKFITNTNDNTLEKVIKAFMLNSKNLYFLVGYFYFSGYNILCEELKEKFKQENFKLKILVGMDIEHQMIKYFKNTKDMLSNINNESTSIDEQKDQWYKSLVDYLQSDKFDKKIEIDNFRMFLEQVKSEKIEIRKTKSPHHAKMYIFEMNETHTNCGQTPGYLITGSSNLTLPGLKEQGELNIRLTDKDDYIFSKYLFDKLWEEAENLTLLNNETLEKFNTKVLNKTFLREYEDNAPYLFYIKALKEYFNNDEEIVQPQEITGESFMNLTYQKDAITKSINIIDKHNGVIIADVVGLGKSIIATTVAYNLQRKYKDLSVIIITPPHLIEAWENYCYDFKINRYKIHSSGKIEDAIEDYNKIYNTNQNKKSKTQTLIIIDEAHKYRNENSKSYALLHKLCANNKVMLLTATPFSNSPSDIYSMLKLFQIPNNSTLETVENLGKIFMELIGDYNKIKDRNNKGQEKNEYRTFSEKDIKKELEKIAKKIRKIIEPLVIRRSRIDLTNIKEYKQDLDIQNITFPEKPDPQIIEYNLGNLEELYENTLKKLILSNEDLESIKKKYEGQNIKLKEIEDEFNNISIYNAVRYKPLSYINENKRQEVEKILEKHNIDDRIINTQGNIADLMRRLLVKRFESSIAAFETTLSYMIDSTKNIKEWIEKTKQVPIYKQGYLPNLEEVDINILFKSNEDTDITLLEENNIIDFKYEEDIKKSEKKKNVSKKLIENRLILIPIEYLKDDYNDLLEKDITILKQIYCDWFGDWEEAKKAKKINLIGKIGEDIKLKSFITELKNEIKIYENEYKNGTEPNMRKIIVFSEAAATIEYLYEQLNKDEYFNEKHKIFKYTSKEANKNNNKILLNNFDANAKIENKNEDKYQILLATDVISEGYNLNQAGTIFNYDIPYNPMKVVQRVGRIDRINKKMFNKIYIKNYFPTEIGEENVKIKEITVRKMLMQQLIIGSDTKVLTEDEILTSYNKNIKNETENIEEQSWETEYRNELYEATKDKEFEKKIIDLPELIRIGRKGKVGNKDNKVLEGVLTFSKINNQNIFKLGSIDKGIENTNNKYNIEKITPQEALKILKATKEEKPYNISDIFYDIYEKMNYEAIDAKNVTKTINKNDIRIKAKKNIKGLLKSLESLFNKTDDSNINYINKLNNAIENDALPKSIYKNIVNIAEDTKKDDKTVINTLKEEIPENYINRIEENIQKIKGYSKNRSIILSEEFLP